MSALKNAPFPHLEHVRRLLEGLLDEEEEQPDSAWAKAARKDLPPINAEIAQRVHIAGTYDRALLCYEPGKWFSFDELYRFNQPNE